MRMREFAVKAYKSRCFLLESACKNLAIAAAEDDMATVGCIRAKLSNPYGHAFYVACEDVPSWVAECCTAVGVKLQSRSARTGGGR